MNVQINGEEQDIPAGTTVRALIERLGLGGQACAAEVNKRVVPKKEHGERELCEGDMVELVTLVGGG